MKAFRFFLNLSLLAGLTIIQIPKSAQCQMTMGMPRAICQMPCCKVPLKAAQCPMMKVSPQHEAIPTFSINVQPYLSALTLTLATAPVLQVSKIKKLTTTIATFLSLTPPPGRAPPADVVLFAA